MHFHPILTYNFKRKKAAILSVAVPAKLMLIDPEDSILISQILSPAEMLQVYVYEVAQPSFLSVVVAICTTKVFLMLAVATGKHIYCLTICNLKCLKV